MQELPNVYGPDVTLSADVFVHPTALIHGRVLIGRGVSIWPYTVIRAEQYEVVLEDYVNVQDFSMIHIGYNCGTYVGSYTSVAHRATLHGCRIGSNCIVGVSATIMDEVEIGDNCIVGAGAMVKERTVVPANSIVVGAPAKVIKSCDSWVANRWNAWLYSVNAKAYENGNYRRWDGAAFIAESKAKMDELRAQAPDSA